MIDNRESKRPPLEAATHEPQAKRGGGEGNGVKRVWKPLDHKGLRLYEVNLRFLGHPERDFHLVVAAQSPRQAAKLIEEQYKDAQWIDNRPPYISGQALSVYQPEEDWPLPDGPN